MSEPSPKPAVEPAAASDETTPPTPAPAAKLFEFPRITWPPRNKRNALLAASVTLAAALGAVFGAVASAGFCAPPARADVAGLEEN